MPVIIKQVDHIKIKTNYPLEIFNFFAEKLGLPVAWNVKQLKGFLTGGGIAAGDINIEFIKPGLLYSMMGSLPARNGIIGIAFQPFDVIESVEKSLDSLEIKYGVPKYYKNKVQGVEKTLITNLKIEGILPQNQVFICKYTYDIDDKRIKAKNEIKKRDGGPAGIESVKEIVVGCSKDKMIEKWVSLLNSKEEGDSFYATLKKGPAVRIVKSPKDSVLSIVFKVKSIDRAKEFLTQENMLGKDHNGIIYVKPEAVQNLEIGFSE